MILNVIDLLILVVFIAIFIGAIRKAFQNGH